MSFFLTRWLILAGDFQSLLAISINRSPGAAHDPFVDLVPFSLDVTSIGTARHDDGRGAPALGLRQQRGGRRHRR